MLDAALLAELRETLAGADYTVDRVVETMGPIAHAALARNHTVPAERALTGRDDPLATLIRLWPLQRPVDRAPLEAALPGLVAPLIRAGILTAGDAAGTITAAVDLRPYATDDTDFWVFSDLTPGLDSHIAPMRSDFVLGLSSASSTLAQLTVRRPVASALDLGTGCSVQTLHLATHAETITATDVNSRALDLAAADPHPQRRRGRAAERLPLRARTGSPLRPDHHQPAVRDVAAPHRRGAAGLPGDRVRRRRADGAPGPARRRPPESRTAPARSSATGRTGPVSPGRSGWRAGSPVPGWTRTWCSAR